jgi:hypothetical protein
MQRNEAAVEHWNVSRLLVAKESQPARRGRRRKSIAIDPGKRMAAAAGSGTASPAAAPLRVTLQKSARQVLTSVELSDADCPAVRVDGQSVCGG